jgi:hypothetical protein
MKFSTSTTISLLTTAALTTATSVRYDAGYDDASRSMTAVACSDGTNGLITRYGWQTQGKRKKNSHSIFATPPPSPTIPDAKKNIF